MTCEAAFQHLPPSPTHLALHGLPKSTVIHQLPHSLTHLFAQQYSSALPLPPSLQCYTGKKVDQSLLNKLGSKLTYLLCEEVQATELPPSLTFLEAENCTLASFPPLLTSLTIYDIEEGLPDFPASIQHLSIQDLTACHLPSLKSLTIHEGMSTSPQSNLSELFPNLTSLVFQKIHPYNNGNLPPPLLKLRFGEQLGLVISSLPPNLTDLYLPDYFTGNPTLPNSLTSLSMSTLFTTPQPMPPLLSRLDLRSHYNAKNPSSFPPGLTHLTLRNDFFTHPVPPLPPNLTHLTIDGELKDKLPLPESITHLSLSFYPHPLPHLPPHLIHLTMGFESNFSLPPLPSSLLFLELQVDYNRPLPPLPPNLKQLTIKIPTYSHPLSLPPFLMYLRCYSSLLNFIQNPFLPPMCFVDLCD